MCPLSLYAEYPHKSVLCSGKQKVSSEEDAAKSIRTSLTPQRPLFHCLSFVLDSKGFFVVHIHHHLRSDIQIVKICLGLVGVGVSANSILWNSLFVFDDIR